MRAVILRQCYRFQTYSRSYFYRSLKPESRETDMNFIHLSNFIQVVEWGNISRAALFLNIAQPALSRQIQSLEDSVGAKLLTRNSSGVALTEDGKILLEHAHRMKKECQFVKERIQSNHDEPSGSVVLGVSAAYAISVVPDLLQRMQNAYPKIEIRIAEAFSGTIYEWLLSGRLDLAILYQTGEQLNAKTLPLLDEKFAVICSPPVLRNRKEISLAEIAEMKIISPWRPHRVRLILESAFLSRKIPYTPEIEIDSLPCMKELVRRGEGITLLPPSSVAREIQAGRLKAIPIAPPGINLSVMVGLPAANKAPLAVSLLIDELKKLAFDLTPVHQWECKY